MKWVGPFLHIPNLPIIVASDDDGNNSIISDDSRKFVGSVREGTSIAPLLIKAGLSQKDIKKQKEGIQIGSRCFFYYRSRRTDQSNERKEKSLDFPSP